jgi:hypothetical protein
MIKRLAVCYAAITLALGSAYGAATLTSPSTGEWVDSMVPATAFALGASAPSLTAFNSGPSVYFFDNNQDDLVHFAVQLNHDYIEGTPIYPHVHWAETATTGAGTNIVFQLTYQWAGINKAFPATATINVTNSVTSTNFVHKISGFGSITNTSAGISSVLIGTIKRLASSATADNYDKGIALLGFDVHYQVDSLGSSLETSK